ncbi:hypothetical protein ABPG72_010621 [Tetrahymena utriculariae]
MDKTLKEADQSYKEGLSQIKTGIFKWSKDYNSAVTYFDDAVRLYTKAGSWEKALKALEQCKICNDKLHEIWGTARNIEAMLNILIEKLESKDFKKIIEFTNEASMLFKGADSHTECIKLKQKVAKYLIQNSQHDEGIKFLESGIEDADASEKMYNKKEIFDYYLEVLVEIGKYSQAISMIKKQFTNPTDTKNRFQTPSYALCIICLCLIEDEVLRAESEFNALCQQIPGFYSAREYEICEAMIKAYNDRDQEEFTALSQKPAVTNLYPSNIPRLLKKKKLKNPQKKLQQQNVQQNQQFSQEQGNLFGQFVQQPNEQENKGGNQNQEEDNDDLLAGL